MVNYDMYRLLLLAIISTHVKTLQHRNFSDMFQCKCMYDFMDVIILKMGLSYAIWSHPLLLWGYSLLFWEHPLLY